VALQISSAATHKNNIFKGESYANFILITIIFFKQKVLALLYENHFHYLIMRLAAGQYRLQEKTSGRFGW
jgi:hypothetical protein